MVILLISIKVEIFDAMTASRTSGKSTYAILLQFFDDGDGSRSGYVVKAFLAYWLFWCMLPNSLEDILNLYVFL